MRDYLTLKKQNDTTGWWWYNWHNFTSLNINIKLFNLLRDVDVEDVHDAVYTNCLENIYICMQT